MQSVEIFCGAAICSFSPHFVGLAKGWLPARALLVLSNWRALLCKGGGLAHCCFTAQQKLVLLKL